MIVLDTNVLSETMRQVPVPRVIDWLDRQPQSELFTTSTVVAELVYGITRLPPGEKQRQLAASLDQAVTSEFLAGVLAFDLAAAIQCGMFIAASEQRGRTISLADAQIAAVCHIHGATLATRNTKDFIDLGISLIDPWGDET